METGDNTIKCPLCHAMNESSAKNCQYCGTAIFPVGSDQRIKPETIVMEALSRDYEIIEIIGKGGMATVYKALHKRLNRTVALKVIHQNLIHDEDLVSRFINEARICAGLNHRNIITVHDIGIIGTVYFIAMEYLEGNDLYSIIRQKGNLSVEETLQFTIPIADALSYMHRLGFIHRDVKSSNVFITKEGRPVLMDFGIVHTNSGKTISTSAEILGTPEYMSPEQAAGNSEMDQRSDIYSFGVMLYEALTGQLPFRGENFLTTLHKVIHEKPKPPIEINRKVPRWLNDLVLTCLQKNKEQRISSADILTNSLTQKIIARPRGKSKGEKILLIAISFILLFLISISVYFLGFPDADSSGESVAATPIISDPTEVLGLDKETDTYFKIDSILPDTTIELSEEIGPQAESITEGFIASNATRESDVKTQPQKPKDRKSNTEETPKTEVISQSNEKKPANQPIEAKQNEKKVLTVDSETTGFRLDDSQMSDLNNLGITMILVKASTNQLTDFYIMQTEVTQALWQRILNSNPSLFKGSNKPVENIDLSEIEFFIQRLNSRTGLKFRLPTVQEWYFSASGGESSRKFTYSGSNIIDNIAWYEENSQETNPVRQKGGNELGIYDMSGNVWERCQGNMMCGGSWLSPGNLCSVRSSRGVGASQKDYTIGFRLVISN